MSDYNCGRILNHTKSKKKQTKKKQEATQLRLVPKEAKNDCFDFVKGSLAFQSKISCIDNNASQTTNAPEHIFSLFYTLKNCSAVKVA